MRAKRRTDKEIAECKRKKDKHKPLPEGCLKADTSQNIEGVEKIIEEHRKLEKTLFPMRINAQTIIYVTAERNNEEYRRKWMKKNGYEENKRMTKENCALLKDRATIDIMAISKQIYEGIPTSEIAESLVVKRSYLLDKLRDGGVSIPTPTNMVNILKNKGYSEEEIVSRTKIKPSIVHKNFMED